MKKRNKLLLIILILFALIIIGCLIYFTQPSPLVLKSSSLATFKNIEYKKDRYLDILLPYEKKFSNIPVIIFFHGGGFVAGSKKGVSDQLRKNSCEQLLKEGYALVSVDYYLARNSISSFPNCIEDCQESFSWVISHADEYGFDKNNIGLWGTSAGAQLAMMVGFTNSESVKFIIDEFGPVDFDKYLSLDFLGIFKKKAEKNSPINYVSIKSPPILILHGIDDKVVPYNQSKELIDKYLSFGNKEFKLISFKEAGHNLEGASDEDKSKFNEEIVNFVLKKRY